MASESSHPPCFVTALIAVDRADADAWQRDFPGLADRVVYVDQPQRAEGMRVHRTFITEAAHARPDARRIRQAMRRNMALHNAYRPPLIEL